MEIGDRVRVKIMNPPGHNRAPRYVRGRTGEVVRHVGRYALPDDAATGTDTPRVDDLLTVVFDARELWGPDAHAHDRVHLDLFVTYLEDA